MSPKNVSFVRQVFKLVLFGIMLSSLYAIDLALGRGFTSASIMIFCRFKCIMIRSVSRWLSFKELFDISNEGMPLVILAFEILSFGFILLLVSRARDRSEQKIDEFLMESKTKLHKTYSCAEKMKTVTMCASCRDISANNHAASGDFEDVDPPNERKTESRHAFYPVAVDENDVIRLSGEEETESEDRLLYNIDEEDDVLIDDYYVQ